MNREKRCQDCRSGAAIGTTTKEPTTTGPIPQGAERIPHQNVASDQTPTQEGLRALLQDLIGVHSRQVQIALGDDALPRPPHLWVVGPRGAGKSHVTRQAAMDAGLPWSRVDVSRYAVAGQPGRNLELLFQEMADAGSAPALTPDGAAVVILEGLDRELAAGSTERGRAMQSEVASLLEGRDLPVRLDGRKMQVNSRRILFVLTFTEPETSSPRRMLGFASSTLQELNPAPPAKLLLGQGLQPALIDLTALQVGLPALTPTDLAAILVRQNGVFTTVTGLFADHGVTLELTTDAQELMAEQAYSLGTGGHALAQLVSATAPRLLEVLPRLPVDIAVVQVTADFVRGSPDGLRCIAGTRGDLRTVKAVSDSPVASHPDFALEHLPHRPTRPANTGASSQGRLANAADLQRWLQ